MYMSRNKSLSINFNRVINYNNSQEMNSQINKLLTTDDKDLKHFL